MSDTPATEFGARYRRLSVLMPARDLTACLWRLFRIFIGDTASELRERAVQRAERRSAVADGSFGRLHRDVLKIEARRLL